MRNTSTLIRSAAVAFALCGLAAPVSLSAQAFAANAVTEAPSLPSVDHSSQAPWHHRKTEDKLIYGHVREGVYTVDGMVAKVQLNYNVDGANYLYMFVPGVGTAVISTTADQDGVSHEAALRGDELSFMVDGHHFNLTGVALANNKGQAPAHLFVRLDRSAWRLNRQPMVGFGNLAELPYEWPGALPPAAAQVEESRAVPPVPASLLPSMTPVMPAASSPVAVNPASLRPVAMR